MRRFTGRAKAGRVVGTGERVWVQAAKQSTGEGAARLEADDCGSDSKATSVPLVSGSAGLNRLRFLYSQVATTLPAALLRVRSPGLGRSWGVRGARCALGWEKRNVASWSPAEWPGSHGPKIGFGPRCDARSPSFTLTCPAGSASDPGPPPPPPLPPPSFKL